MDLQLKNKLVLVTGSSRGIGRAIAECFLEEGARVILTGRGRDDLTATGKEFSEKFPGQVFSRLGNLSEPEFLEVTGAWLEAEFGALDALVCNIGSGKSMPPLQEDLAEWRRMLEINLLNSVSSAYAFLPLLEKGAGKNGGYSSLTLVSSICGEEALGCPVAYASAKTALNAFAKSIARPLASRGVRVNVVSPGNMIFPGSTWENKLAANQAAVEEMLEREVPMKRLGAADEAARVVVFVSSPAASFVSGADWIVDGGQTRDI